MKSQITKFNQPDSPIRGLLKPFRVLVRQWRLLRLRLTLLILYGCIVIFGKNVAIGARPIIRSRREFRLGDKVRIGSDFTCYVNLRIGKGTLISGSVSIVGNDHPIDVPEEVFEARRSDDCFVELEGDNLIGFGAIIIGPCKIGRGAVVGAGCVVSSNLAPNTIYAGVPARALRQRRRRT